MTFFSTVRWLALVILLVNGTQVFAQKVDFTLRYNESAQHYEVFGKADFSDPQFFVGGGSQLSIVLPTDLVDYPLTVTSFNGGPWTDNSQIYAPSSDPKNDFHGIATNGSRMAFQPGVETLLFTFELPKKTPSQHVRLFDNRMDPHSNRAGMAGGDFCNFFACALTMSNVYGTVYRDLLPQDLELTTPLTVDQSAPFTLEQNKPNPFQQQTDIQFRLPKSAAVTLTLRDGTGRTLRVISVDGQTGLNTLSITDAGLPRGLLHYQLDTPFGSKNRKMLVLE